MVSFNPISTSGIGFKLEHYVQVSYLSSLIIGTPVPFSEDLIIKELLFQAKHVGETDDLIVVLEKRNQRYRHYLQAKKGFEINKNETFDKVIKAAYEDFGKSAFDDKHDKFIIFTDVLSNTDADEALPMLEWARFSNSSSDFLKKLELNKAKRNKYTYFKNSLDTAASKTLSNDEVWCFLKCFYVKANDYLSSGSKDTEVLKWYLKPHLNNRFSPEAALNKLIDFIVISNQHGATLQNENIPNEIKEIFDLTSTDKIGNELKELLKKSSNLIDAIDNTIDDFHLLRDNYIQQINKAINQSNFVVLTGDGGVGKSAIIKEYLNLAFNSELGYISIKADILDRSSLVQTLSEIGIHIGIETIISQWLHLPRLIMYIDSFEKLYESNHSEAFIELFKIIKGRSNITLLATCRTYAFETLRKKFKIPLTDIINVPVYPLTKNELNIVVQAKPQLQNLIQNSRLLKVLSLPFYLDQAFRLTETLTEAENISESDFKNAIWEQGIEKKGTGKAGHSKKRGIVFSRIVLKRANQKQAYISCDENDLEIAEELFNEGLLIKHPKNENYAPKHDILEDIVVGKFLDKAFAEKANTKQFIESIDTNPVIRRGLRLWIQGLILNQPAEAIIFLKETLELYSVNESIIDELLIGILGSEYCYTLLYVNQDLILEDNLKLFIKLLHLLKIAYTIHYTDDPTKGVKCFGPGWDALVRFLNNHYATNPDGFDTIVTDLFIHWTHQYEIDDKLPESAKEIAIFCLSKIQSNVPSIHKIDKLLVILFFVIPAAEADVRDFLQKAKEATKVKKVHNGIPVSIYRMINEMLLIEPFKCEKVYKYFPNEIIELAKIEWYRNSFPNDYSIDYMEASFGLVSHPYNYFSPSALQTPLRYLLKYHFQTALDFIIGLANRGMHFYVRSTYAEDLKEIKITLNTGEILTQLGNASLFLAYRGSSSTPYLIQSVLMALEVSLLEKASLGEELSESFLHTLKSSNSILLTSVYISIAVAYPFSLGKEIDAILKIRDFFNWDFTRYTSEYGISSTTIGNDSYYTSERYESNQLRHRKENLEFLVNKLQLYRGAEITNIIDDHLSTVHPEDNLWKLALIRMDIRNTEPKIIEEEDVQKIAFIPKPLPTDIQQILDDSNKDQHHNNNATSIFLYGQKLYKGELGEDPSISEWRENYKKLISIDFTKVDIFRSPDITFAAGSLKYFSKELLHEEKELCLNTILTRYQSTIDNLRLGQTPVFGLKDSSSVYNILPKLFASEFNGLVDPDKIKSYIIDLLLLGDKIEKKALITGIKTWMWDLDPEFADKCFQICLKDAKGESVNNRIYEIKPAPTEISKVIDRLIQEVISKPDIGSNNLSLLIGNRYKIAEAIELIPYRLLAGQYFPFLESIVNQLVTIDNLDSHNEQKFVSKLEILLAYFLLSETNESTTKINSLLLFLSNKHFKVVMAVFQRVVAIGHDRNYPETLWDRFYEIWNYMVKMDPKIGFMHIILFDSLKYPETANKLPNNGRIKSLHKSIISNPVIENSNILPNVFKLLSSVGTVYQPESLKWLMSSLPYYKNFKSSLNAQFIAYFEKYVVQLYDNHINHIKINRDLLEYYILLLNVLISFGSREAFRIRDIVV